MNRIFEPEVDFNSLEVFIVIFVLLLFRHIVFEFTVHTCMPNARRSGPVVATKERKLGPPAAACYESPYNRPTAIQTPLTTPIAL